MAPPFRADQIGSLIRPQSLLDVRNANPTPTGTDRPAAVASATEEAIADVVTKQVKNGVRPITSGEFERNMFLSGFLETLSGIETQMVPAEHERTDFALTAANRGKGWRAHIATGRITWTRSAYLDDWNYLKSLLPENLWASCKWTIPPPTQTSIRMKPGTVYAASSGYTSEREYFTDLTVAYRKEIRALYDAGLRNMQVDDPYFTFVFTEWFQSGLRKDGQDTEELLDLYIWTHNELLRDRPADLHVGLHLCRGNLGKVFFATGSYEPLAEKLFKELNYDTYYLEYDTERAGDFEPLRHLPVGKNVVLGIVSTKEPELEDIDACVAKVHEAARIIAEAQGRSRDEIFRDVLGVSPQCGFSSASFARAMTEDQQFEKLALVKRIANRIWPQEDHRI